MDFIAVVQYLFQSPFIILLTVLAVGAVIADKIGDKKENN